MLDLLAVIRERLGNGEFLALATIVSREGSAPRGQGARLLADDSGLIHGTVGGGAAEAAVLDSCADVLRNGGARLLDLTLTNAMAAQEGMVCGGTVRLYVELLSPDQETRDFFAAVATALRDGGGVLLARLASGRDVLPERAVYITGAAGKKGTTGAVQRVIGPPLEAEAEKAFLAALETRGFLPEPGELSLGGKAYFAEPFFSKSRMIIAGAGHVAVPTAEVAALAGFAVHVLDDRPEFVRADRFPKALSLRAVPEFSDCLAPFVPDARTCIVIITRGHLYDGTVLAQALHTKAGYIGMIGSRKKRESVYAALREQGVGDADLARVHCPVGLPIGAETPEEIAVSIVSECIAHKRGKLD